MKGTGTWSMQVCPQPLEQHFWSELQSASLLHSSEQIPTASSSRTGQEKKRGAGPVTAGGNISDLGIY